MSRARSLEEKECLSALRRKHDRLCRSRSTYHTPCSRDVRTGRTVKVTGPRWGGRTRDYNAPTFSHVPGVSSRKARAERALYWTRRHRGYHWDAPIYKSWDLIVYVVDDRGHILGTKPVTREVNEKWVPLLNKEGICVSWTIKNRGVHRHHNA